MKGFRWVFGVMMVFLLGVSGFAASDKTISFATDAEKDGGFLLEITKAAFAKVGYNVKVEYFPWARALVSVYDGTYDALLGAQYTDERAQKLLYSELLGKSNMVFFKLKSAKISYTTMEDLKSYTIGTIAQSNYPPQFAEATYLKKEDVTNFIQNIDKLLAGRIDMFVEKKYVVLNTLKTKYPNQYEKVDYLPNPLAEYKFYNCFSKKVAGFEQKAADFNKGLAQIIKDGTYQKIMDKQLHE